MQRGGPTSPQERVAACCQEQLCGRFGRGRLKAGEDPAAPAQCAKMALGGRALQSAKFASRVEQLRAVSILALCSSARNTEPAQCWLAVPAATRQQMLTASATSNAAAGMEAEIATLPLVQICRDAQDDRPARCYLTWLKSSGTSSNSDARDAVDTVTTLCRSFGGQVAALEQCVKPIVRLMGTGTPAALAALQLCRFVGDGSNLPAMVECVSDLRKKRVSPSTTAQLCGKATGDKGDGNKPQTCFLAAQKKLRWMDQESQVALCEDVVARSAIAPVDCAVEMKTFTQSLASSSTSAASSSMFLVLNILDQYGDAMVDTYRHQHSRGAVYVSAVFIDHHDQPHQQTVHHQPILRGSSYAAIVNGSAVFSDLLFTAAGEFVLTFRAGVGVTEEVARVLVHADEAAEALQARCHGLFDRFECSSQPLPSQYDLQHSEHQLLLLPRRFQLNAVSCQQYWLENVGGLGFRGFSRSHDAVYALPRPLYDLFTCVVLISFAVHRLVERADSLRIAHALLGLREGETNRAAIRRAYHRRSLEWHPDKWHALAVALPPAWQQTLGGIYTLVTQAYDQLVRLAR
ncbi:hypothetical protein BBJ28_00000474 [Nothophytophthora sp. Chile5]|nr:hypothetical protein BBJ28_00000474 [Nothophytophthora sp. Chile5]